VEKVYENHSTRSRRSRPSTVEPGCRCLAPVISPAGRSKYFATSATRRLNGARFIGAARHEDTVFAVPFPVEPSVCAPSDTPAIEARHRASAARHRWRSDFANRPRAGPREAADFVESGAGQPLSARREGDHRFRSNLEGQCGRLRIRIDVAVVANLTPPSDDVPV